MQAEQNKNFLILGKQGFEQKIFTWEDKYHNLKCPYFLLLFSSLLWWLSITQGMGFAFGQFGPAALPGSTPPSLCGPSLRAVRAMWETGETLIVHCAYTAQQQPKKWQ